MTGLRRHKRSRTSARRMVRSVSGMGLGLTICRGIVDAHGGRIWCENTEGGGATFRFVLPRGDIPELIEP